MLRALRACFAVVFLLIALVFGVASVRIICVAGPSQDWTIDVIGFGCVFGMFGALAVVQRLLSDARRVRTRKPEYWAPL